MFSHQCHMAPTISTTIIGLPGESLWLFSMLDNCMAGPFFFLSDSLPTILSISVSFFSKGNNKRHPNKHKQQEKRKIIKESRTYRRIDRTRSDDSSDLPQVIDVVESGGGGDKERVG